MQAHRSSIMQAHRSSIHIEEWVERQKMSCTSVLYPSPQKVGGPGCTFLDEVHCHGICPFTQPLASPPDCLVSIIFTNKFIHNRCVHHDCLAATLAIEGHSEAKLAAVQFSHAPTDDLREAAALQESIVIVNIYTLQICSPHHQPPSYWRTCVVVL